MSRNTGKERLWATRWCRQGLWPAVLVAAMSGSPATAQSDTSTAAGLRACASVSDADDRLACFDTLAAELGSGRSAVEPKKIAVAPDAEPADVAGATAASAAAGGVAAGSAGSAAPPLDDAVGKDQLDDQEQEPEVWSGRLTECEKSAAMNRWYFYFDNGQVWRQSNAGRLSFRECDFDVTVERDLFGFKLSIPSIDKTIRVARVR